MEAMNFTVRQIWQFSRKFILPTILYVIVGLIEHAVFGWGDMKLGITNEYVNNMVRSLLQYGIPAATVLVFFFFYYLMRYFSYVNWKDNRVSNHNELASVKVRDIKDTLDRGEMVSMTEAATKAYEEARKVGSMWAYIAESNVPKGADLKTAEEVILKTMANLVAGKIPVYGVRPPSRLLELVDTNDQMKEFSNKASEYRKLFGGRILYTNLQVKKADIEKVQNYLRGSLKANDPI